MENPKGFDVIFISAVRKVIKKYWKPNKIIAHHIRIGKHSCQPPWMSSACPVTVHSAHPQPQKVTITLIPVVITFLYFLSVLLPKCVSLHTVFYLIHLKLLWDVSFTSLFFLHVPLFFLFLKIYQLENLVWWFTVSQVCIVLIAGSWHSLACSSVLWTLTHGSRGLSRLLARRSGSVFLWRRLNLTLGA